MLPTTRNRTHISRSDLIKQLQSNAAPMIIDVRSAWEFHRGHVPGAVHMPFMTILLRLGEIPVARHAPIVVYCEHGPRAKIAGFFLRRAGFGQVCYLQGHMWRWRKDGLPMQGTAHDLES